MPSAERNPWRRAQGAAAALSFEGANPRYEHEWTVFEDVRLPDDRVIIVHDSTTNFIEHPELVAQRLVRYAGVVGRERVIAGSDCGFATFARSSPVVEPEIAWAKFRAMAEGARLASARRPQRSSHRKAWTWPLFGTTSSSNSIPGEFPGAFGLPLPGIGACHTSLPFVMSTPRIS